MSLYGVYGAGGCGRGVMPIARAFSKEVAIKKFVFVDDSVPDTCVNGHYVLSFDDFLKKTDRDKSVAIAIADGTVRRSLAIRCAEKNLRFFSVIAENAIMMDDVQIGEGAIISPFVTITSNINIGVHFHANIHSIIEHDCVIGDFVTFAPGVRCNGNNHIDDFAYIGAGAVIKQGRPGRPLRIGRGATIGMGAVVTHDVEDGVTVVGNPARPMKR